MEGETRKRERNRISRFSSRNGHPQDGGGKSPRALWLLRCCSRAARTRAGRARRRLRRWRRRRRGGSRARSGGRFAWAWNTNWNLLAGWTSLEASGASRMTRSVVRAGRKGGGSGVPRDEAAPPGIYCEYDHSHRICGKAGSPAWTSTGAVVRGIRRAHCRGSLHSESLADGMKKG